MIVRSAHLDAGLTGEADEPTHLVRRWLVPAAFRPITLPWITLSSPDITDLMPIAGNEIPHSRPRCRPPGCRRLYDAKRMPMRLLREDVPAASVPRTLASNTFPSHARPD